MAVKEIIRNTPVLRNLSGFFYRIYIASTYLIGPIWQFFQWLFRSNEMANFTYDLTNQNKLYLSSMIAGITAKPFNEILSYITELESDHELRTHIQGIIRSSEEKHFADLDIHYGRRLGWYAFVRATKPKIIVETGVDKGMGSCVLTSALIRNEQEGFPGFYYGTDINPRAGYMLSGRYKDSGEILYGDSIESLKKLNKIIDIFINDSDHSAEYEEREYQVVSDRLSPYAIVLGDNAHVTDKLLKFAHLTNRQYLFFQEKPKNHWYPGAGIGIAYRDERLMK